MEERRAEPIGPGRRASRRGAGWRTQGHCREGTRRRARPGNGTRPRTRASSRRSHRRRRGPGQGARGARGERGPRPVAKRW
jgi:hypothetical protein